MTYRTTKEAFGTQLSRGAFEEDTKDRPVVIACAIACIALVGLALGPTVIERYDVFRLIKHQCRPVDTLADDDKTMLWDCVDGYRIGPVDVVRRAHE